MRHDQSDMFFFHANPFAYLVKSAGSRGALSAGHRGGPVVGYNHGYRRLVVYRVEQPRDSRMGKGGVANHAYGGPYSRVGCSLGHGDGGPHVHAGADGAIGGKCSQRVASNIAKHTGIGVVGHYLVEGIEQVSVAASLAEHGGPSFHDIWDFSCFPGIHV